MQRIQLICVGRLKESFFVQACGEYEKRLSRYCTFECLELPETGDLEKDGAAILKKLPPDAFVVAMCVEGEQMPSEAMARLLAERENSGRPKLCFVIGGSNGLDESVKDRADLRLSMSKMTFPHHLARVMLAEQVYRGYKIREGSKYHK